MTYTNAQYDENVLKAVYFEHFTRFIEWPSTNLSDTSKTFIIGITDENDFSKILRQIFDLKTIKKRKVKVISIKKTDDLVKCNICYLSNIKDSKLHEWIANANKSGVLLFSDSKGYANEGVHINFFSDKNKVRFEINEKSIKSAGFKISHLLLKSALII